MSVRLAAAHVSRQGLRLLKVWHTMPMSVAGCRLPNRAGFLITRVTGWTLWFATMAWLLVVNGGCRGEGQVSAMDWQNARMRMVERQISARGVTTPRVLEAMMGVERHRFVPENMRDLAYTDQPLPIGHGQTISQPYIVALMTDLMETEPADTVLEIGTGSGYQSAVLASLVSHVYSIEIIPELAQDASERLGQLGCLNVTVRAGDGYRGWPEHAPFDAIIVTAAPPRIPRPLLEQLAVGGRMVVPVGDAFQELQVILRDGEGYQVQRSIPVRFVPMVGEAQHE